MNATLHESRSAADGRSNTGVRSSTPVACCTPIRITTISPTSAMPKPIGRNWLHYAKPSLRPDALDCSFVNDELAVFDATGLAILHRRRFVVDGNRISRGFDRMQCAVQRTHEER